MLVSPGNWDPVLSAVEFLEVVVEARSLRMTAALLTTVEKSPKAQATWTVGVEGHDSPIERAGVAARIASTPAQG